jgi:hypothetical protein
MLLLGRAIHARPFCEKSASAHFKMSPLLRANWQNFFSGSTLALGGKRRPAHGCAAARP